MSTKWHIHLRELAGVRTILGLDLAQSQVRVVELQAEGSPIRSQLPGVRLKHHFEVPLDQTASPAEKGALLKNALLERKISTRHVVSAISQNAVRTVTARVPANTDRIDEWIEEHVEGLLRIPAALNELNYRHEVLSQDAESKEIEISFIRRQDLLKVLELVEAAGLELVGIAPGISDVSRLLDQSGASEGEIIHVEEKVFIAGLIQHGRWRRTEVHPIQELEAFMKTDSSNTDDPEKMFISGNFSQATPDHIVRLEAFGLPSEYALAASLALRGFESDAPRDFLPSKLKTSFEASVNKSLLQRLVIASGMMLIILLLLPMLLEFYLQGRLDDLDATMGESRSQTMEITALERQIENLESQLGGGKSSIRSNNAQLLQELAKRTPEGVWLYRLNLGEKASRRLKLSGYAKSHEVITAYLKELERLEMMRSVSLVRQGAPEQDEPIESVARSLPGLVTFEISGEIR